MKVFFLALLFASVSVFSEQKRGGERELCDTIPEKSRLAIKAFFQALNESDPKKVDSITGQHGMAIFRNFVSGTYGARGNNLRQFYASPLRRMKFPIKGETPIDLTMMFSNFKEMNLATLPGFRSDIAFDIDDSPKSAKPTTSIVLKNLETIMRPHGSLGRPFVVLFQNGFILAESDGVDDQCTGNFAFFKKTAKGYQLRAILDLR